MKHNLFSLLILLFSISVLFSSCEKELLGCTDPTASNYNDLANTDDGSCIEPVLGCTDLNAMNYESLASSDDGTCVYAYDLALGIWDINTECDDLTISILGLGDIPVPLNDVFPESIEIFAEGEGVISMDINGEPILADVSVDGTVTIQDGQQITTDTGIPTVGEVDVDITGSGLIQSSTSGILTLFLSFEIPLAGTQSSSCNIVCSR